MISVASWVQVEEFSGQWLTLNKGHCVPAWQGLTCRGVTNRLAQVPLSAKVLITRGRMLAQPQDDCPGAMKSPVYRSCRLQP